MHMDSDTLHLLLHLKQLSKPISSDLPTNLLYLLDAVCVCVCVCVCARARMCVVRWSSYIGVFFLLVLSMHFYVCTMWCGSCRSHVFEYCCNCSVFSCQCYAVPFNQCFYLYLAIVKHVVLIFVNALYKSPLLLLWLLLCCNSKRHNTRMCWLKLTISVDINLMTFRQMTFR